MNRVTLMGYMGNDPETKQVGATTITEFSLATNRKVKRQDQYVDETTWHRVKFWGVAGDNVARYFSKGSKILIEGRIENRSYQDKDGIVRYVTDIIGDTFYFVDKKSSDDSNYDSAPEGYPDLPL